MTTKLEGENVAERMASILMAKANTRLLVRTAVVPVLPWGYQKEPRQRVATHLITNCKSGDKEVVLRLFCSYELGDPSRWYRYPLEIEKFPQILADQNRKMEDLLYYWKSNNQPFFSLDEVVEYHLEEGLPIEKWSTRWEHRLMLVLHYTRLYGRLEGLIQAGESRGWEDAWAVAEVLKRFGAFLKHELSNWKSAYGPSY